MVNGAGGFDQFFSPTGRFIVLGQKTDESDERGERGGRIKVVMVSSPPKRIAQVGGFGGKPCVCLALARAVPQSHDLGFEAGEVVGVRGTHLHSPLGRAELTFGEMTDRL